MAGFEYEVHRNVPFSPGHIPLGQGKTLSTLDVSRALLCSQAVYAEVPEAEYIFREAQQSNSGLAFEKVNMSLDFGTQKFLVAYAADAIFIAFKGTAALEDVASNLQANPFPHREGSFHSGFFKRTDVFHSSGHNPLKTLFVTETEKRFVFCGHSLGGAVSHLALLRFLWETLTPAELKDAKFQEKFSDSLFSIAFGAPYVCDQVLADEVNEIGIDIRKRKLQWRFINFVYKDDPVPRLLHDLPGVARTVMHHTTPVLRDATTVLVTVGGFIGRAVVGYATGGVRGALQSAGKGLVSQAANTIGLVAGSGLTERWIGSTWRLRESEAPRRFAPMGQYVFLTADDGQLITTPDSYESKHLLSQEAHLHKKALSNHTLKGYAEGLAACHLVEAGIPSVDLEVSGPGNEEKTLVSSPGPKVQFAKLKITDTSQRYLHIRGSNLLFLRAHVSLNGDEDWRTVMQTNEELKVFEPANPLRAGQKRTSVTDSIRIAIVKTAFGQCEAAVVEDFGLGELEVKRAGVRGSFPKCIQSVLVKAQPPLSITPRTTDLEMMDTIFNCVPALKGRSIQRSIRLICEGVKDKPEKTQEEIENINKLVQEAMAFLSAGFIIEYTKKALKVAGIALGAIGLFAAGTGLVVATAGVGAFFLGYAATLLGAGIGAGVTATSAVAGVGFGVAGAALSKEQVLIDSYADTLRLAVSEARLWVPEMNHKGDLPTDENEQLECLEKELGILLPMSTAFAELVGNPDAKTLPQLKDPRLAGATEETRRNLLRRIKMIVLASDLYEPIRATRFVGIVGAEDAGKSTFIKKVLQSRGKNEKLPAVGDDIHTSAVYPYEVNKSLWLVDFPGGNGLKGYADAWQQFTSLPSAAILLLHFNNDIKREHVEMYQNMKKSLETSHVIVAFNRVDEKFREKADKKYPDDYFSKLKKTAMEALKCTEEEVQYICLDPEDEKKWERLQELGVLGFEQFAKLALKLDCSSPQQTN